MSGGARGRLDTFFTRFMVEAYDRERDARLAFWQKNRLSQDPSDPSYEPSARIKVWRKRVEGAIVRPSEEIVAAAKLRDKKFYRHKHETMYDDAILARAKASKMADEIILPDMRPASPRTRRKLYHGLSHEERGRYEYLEARKQKDPEQKYRHPVTSNFDVGWRVLEMVPPSELKFSKYALTRLVEETFYTRNYIPSLNLHKNLYQNMS